MHYMPIRRASRSYENILIVWHTKTMRSPSSAEGRDASNVAIELHHLQDSTKYLQMYMMITILSHGYD
jgi:hypothetical protein